MHIPIFVLILIFVIAFLLITPYRQAIISLVIAGWYAIATTTVQIWNFLRGNVTPRRLGTLGVVLAVVASAAICLPYALVGAGVVTIGAIVGKFKIAMLLVVILMIMGVVFSLPGLAIFRPVQWANRRILWPVAVCLVGFLLISAAWWGFGKFSPETQKAVSRSAKCQATETANWLDKRSLQSEKESGIFARISKDCRVYNESSQAFTSLKDEDLVYVISTEGKEKTMDGEGMTQVMLPNQDGDFIGGKRGWIPSRNINWDWDKDKEVAPVVEEKSATQDKDVRKLIETVKVDGSRFPQMFLEYLPPGEYQIQFEPVEAGEGAQLSILLPNEEVREEEIEKNHFFVKEDERGFAIGTKIPAVAQIYAR